MKLPDLRDFVAAVEDAFRELREVAGLPAVGLASPTQERKVMLTAAPR